MSFTFSLNLLTITEVLGLVLAVIGFFNLSEKLEAMFVRVREYSNRFSAYEIKRAKKLWPPHKHISRLALEVFDSLPTVIVLVGGYLWLSGYYPQVRDFVLSLSLTLKVAFWSGVVVALIINELLAQYVLSRIFWALASMMEKVFWLLGKPPSGVTGTIGLLLSIASFGLTHLV